MEKFDLVYLACDCLDKNSGKDILIVDTEKVPNLVDSIILTTASDHTQVSLLAEKVTETLEKKKVELVQREGFGITDWIALDFGVFFVHIFTKDVRDKYNMEKLIVDGKNSKKFDTIKKEVEKSAKKQLKEEKQKETTDKKLQKQKETKSKDKTKKK